MDKELQYLIDHGILYGTFDSSKVSGMPPEWFTDRQVDFLDFRGDLQLRSTEICLGRHVRLITAGHVISNGKYGPQALKHVWIEKDTFIGSYSILYNCTICEGAVVSVGSVVANMIIPPFHMVEGNPARLIGVFKDGLWRRIEGHLSIPEHLP